MWHFQGDESSATSAVLRGKSLGGQIELNTLDKHCYTRASNYETPDKRKSSYH